jgi:hypothetical protein
VWYDKELDDKIKLKYYKGVVKPNLEDRKYLLVFSSAKKKINIAKTRTTNSHALENFQTIVG